MAEGSVNFTTKHKGYDKEEVDQFVKDVEVMLQDKAILIAKLQGEVAELEAKLQKVMGDDISVTEKAELYDKLMEKMKGDYANLLAPAVAKAKELEAKAEEEYAIRIDQARYSAEGIYKEAAERISSAVDKSVDKLCDVIDGFLYSKTIPGRIESLIGGCNKASESLSKGAHNACSATKRATAACVEAKAKAKAKVNGCREKIVAFKNED